eukprot:Tbor_TRINITY_DN5900_c6_g2::TRINITY_DN5900_c6_g2_i1::g.18207::m.18207
MNTSNENDEIQNNKVHHKDESVTPLIPSLEQISNSPNRKAPHSPRVVTFAIPEENNKDNNNDTQTGDNCQASSTDTAIVQDDTSLSLHQGVGPVQGCEPSPVETRTEPSAFISELISPSSIDIGTYQSSNPAIMYFRKSQNMYRIQELSEEEAIARISIIQLFYSDFVRTVERYVSAVNNTGVGSSSLHEKFVALRDSRVQQDDGGDDSLYGSSMSPRYSSRRVSDRTPRHHKDATSFNVMISPRALCAWSSDSMDTGTPRAHDSQHLSQDKATDGDRGRFSLRSSVAAQVLNLMPDVHMAAKLKDTKLRAMLLDLEDKHRKLHSFREGERKRTIAANSKFEKIKKIRDRNLSAFRQASNTAARVALEREREMHLKREQVLLKDEAIKCRNELKMAQRKVNQEVRFRTEAIARATLDASRDEYSKASRCVLVEAMNIRQMEERDRENNIDATERRSSRRNDLSDNHYNNTVKTYLKKEMKLLSTKVKREHKLEMMKINGSSVSVDMSVATPRMMARPVFKDPRDSIMSASRRTRSIASSSHNGTIDQSVYERLCNSSGSPRSSGITRLGGSGGIYNSAELPIRSVAPYYIQGPTEVFWK